MPYLAVVSGLCIGHKIHSAREIIYPRREGDSGMCIVNYCKVIVFSVQLIFLSEC